MGHSDSKEETSKDESSAEETDMYDSEGELLSPVEKRCHKSDPELNVVKEEGKCFNIRVNKAERK